MIVKANHPNVDIDGTVTMPYLIQWNSNCSLTLLVQHLSTHFSQDPPLYAKPTHTPSPPHTTIANNSVYSPQNLSNDNNQNWYTQTPDPYVASTSSSYTHNNYSNPTYTTPTTHPIPVVNSSVYPNQKLNPISSSSYGQSSAYTNTAYSQPTNTLYNSTGSSNSGSYNNNNTYNSITTSIPTNVTPASASYALNQLPSQFSHLSTPSGSNYPVPSYPGHNSGNTFPAQSKREKLERELTNKLQQILSNKQILFNKEIQNELTIQKQLNESYNNIQTDLKNMNKYKENISELLTIINTKNLELEEWADKQQQQEQNTNNNTNDIESYIIPYDDISTQLIKLSAEIKVIDDLIYYIIKAKVASAIDLSSFLKEIRRLSSNQFLLRMHMLKINASIAHAITTANTTNTNAIGNSAYPTSTSAGVGGGGGTDGGGYMNGSSNSSGGLK